MRTAPEDLRSAPETNKSSDAAFFVCFKKTHPHAIAVQSEVGVPVKFIGVGEKIEDLQRFNPDEYVDALFYRD